MYKHLFAPCQTGKNGPGSALLIQAAGLGPCYQVQQVLLHLVVSPRFLFIIHIGNHQHSAAYCLHSLNNASSPGVALHWSVSLVLLPDLPHFEPDL